MRFRELEYVLSIAKHQSIGKAAKELYVSQPTLSKFVQNLERSIGQPLFCKLGNRFVLTYAGQRYVDAARSILDTKKQLENELADINQESTGELRVAFRLCAGIGIFPELFAQFQRQYPRIKLSVQEDSSGNMEQDLIGGEVDLAFVTLPIKHPSILYEELNCEELLLVMPSGHPCASAGIKTPLNKYPWFDLSAARYEQFILQHPSQKSRQLADELFRQYKIKPDIALTMSNIEVAVQLSSEGYGLTFAGEVPLRQIRTDRPISLFSVGKPKTELSFAVAYREGIYFSSAMRAFVSMAKSILRGD